MGTLTTQGVLGDNLNQAMMFCYNASIFLNWVFIIFLVISSVTLFNMLIGVLCEVITDVAEQEKEDSQKDKFNETLEVAFKQLDKSQDGYIQKNEWAKIQGDDKMKEAFIALGIEKDKLDDHLKQLEDSLFVDNED